MKNMNNDEVEGASKESKQRFGSWLNRLLSPTLVKVSSSFDRDSGKIKVFKDIRSGS